MISDAGKYLSSIPPTKLGTLSVVGLALLAFTLVASIYWSRRAGSNALEKQVHRRLGAGIALWAVCESVLVLWRFAGIAEPRLFSYIGLLFGFLLVTYVLVYATWRLPRQRPTFLALKERYETGTTPKAMERDRKDEVPSTGWAQLGAAGGALVLWLAMYPSTDHALHWVMIVLGGTLGYGLGLVLIAGWGASTLAWNEARRNKNRRGVAARSRSR